MARGGPPRPSEYSGEFDTTKFLADGLESPWDDLWFYSNPVFVHVR
ncbi:hypothetical protein [Micromonospora profundi]